MTRTAVLLLLASRAFAQTDWPSFGNDPGAMRYSSLRQIDTGNVGRLQSAWTFRTGKPGSEAVPVVIGGVMYVTAPDGVYALVPETGELLWKHDGSPMALRGLAYWPGSGGLHPRVFAGNGPYLLALDVTTGKPAPGFGDEGRVDLKKGVLGDLKDGRYALQSPPAIFGDVVITGCSNGEGSPTAGAYGDIRGWDARTGKLLWTFHTVPRPGEPGSETWPPNAWKNRSGTNTWGFLTVDVKRGIVYVPLGSPTADFYGKDRVGDGLYGNSLVALDARTGAKKWHRQLVHHDLWDYDLAAPPALFDIRRDGRVIPAVAQITKMGLLFVFDRVTGEPVYGMEERPVAQSAIPGEVTSKTQPFPVKPPPLGKNTFRMEEMYDRSPEHAAFCKELFASNQMKVGGPFAPLPLEGNALFFPSTLGGGNWGGVSVDPTLGLLFVNVMHLGQWGHMEKRGRGVRADLCLRSVCSLLESRYPHPLPESSVRRNGRRGSGIGRYRLAHAARANRGAGGDRRAGYGDPQPGRQHRDGWRAGVYRRDDRRRIPRVRFEGGQGAVGDEARGQWACEPHHVHGTGWPPVCRHDGRRRRRIFRRRHE